jgi:hypothetical protein
MLRIFDNVSRYRIAATDGEIGHLDDFYFDDQHWAVRYLVVDTRLWLPGRRVLISPISVAAVAWEDQSIAVDLTMERIRNSPDVDTAKPVSRQYETDFNAYYGYPYYWSTSGIWPGAMYPSELAARPHAHPRAEPETPPEATHLRSAREVKGYHIAAADGDVGHVDEFVVDDRTWAVPYLVADTSNWPGGRAVLVPTNIIREISWHPSLVHVDATREEIRSASPEGR